MLVLSFGLKKKAIQDGFGSEKNGQIMTWGQQLFIKIKDLKILGYSNYDYEILRKDENYSKWNKYKR